MTRHRTGLSGHHNPIARTRRTRRFFPQVSKQIPANAAKDPRRVLDTTPTSAFLTTRIRWRITFVNAQQHSTLIRSMQIDEIRFDRPSIARFYGKIIFHCSIPRVIAPTGKDQCAEAHSYITTMPTWCPFSRRHVHKLFNGPRHSHTVRLIPI